MVYIMLSRLRSSFMPSHKVLSALGGSGLLLGLACVFALPQAASAQYYGPGYYYRGPYGPYSPGYYYDGPYRRHGYYAPDEADLGPEPYRNGPPPAAPAPRKKIAAPPASQPNGNKSEAKKNEPLTRDMIVKKVQGAGYKLIAKPRHTGNIFLAWAEDNQANRRRLVFDATDGRLLENTVLGPVKGNKAASSRAE